MFAHVDLVPAHVRALDFSREARALTGKHPSAGSFRSFRTSFIQPLHADADAQKWLALGKGLQQRQPELSIQCLTAIEVSHTRHNQLFRRGNHPCIRSDLSNRAQMFERFFHRADVARAIIDNGDHSSPLVLGSMPANCLSREQATRRARPNALNNASILW